MTAELSLPRFNWGECAYKNEEMSSVCTVLAVGDCFKIVIVNNFIVLQLTIISN